MSSSRINKYLFLFILLIISSCRVNTDESQKEPALFAPDGLKATVWAEAPMFYNPTNIDVDIKGRIWVTEAVNYRDFKHDTTQYLYHSQGDRVVILEDTDGDGKADTSKVFVQDKDLVSPLGIAVIGNKVIVSCSPNIIVYTDKNGDDKPDKKEIFLTGFGGIDHDHGLHSGVAGPDGKWYFSAGDAGPYIVTDKSGWTLRSGSVYAGGTPYDTANTPAMKSDDGRIWTGGLVFRINPDGTGLKVMAYNFRNSYETAIDSYGNMWQSDNDDQVDACRMSWVMEGGNAGFFSKTGVRTWQADRRPGQSIQAAHWHQGDPGVMPAGDIYGAGAPTGIVMYEGDAIGKKYRGLLLCADAGRNTIFAYKPKLKGAGYPLDNRMHFISSVDTINKAYRWYKVSENKRKWFRPSDIAIGTDGAIYIADWYDPIVGGHQLLDKKGVGRIYRIVPKNKELLSPAIDLSTVKGQIQALLSPAINVRNQGFMLLKARGSQVIPEVKSILSSNNPYHRARAVWLLSQLGNQGIKEVEKLLQDNDPHIRITAFRALREANPKQLLKYAHQLSEDGSPAVRRAVAVALRDVPLKECETIVLSLVDGYDGKDPWYLNALGIALDNKEEAFYPDLLQHFNAGKPENWPRTLANIVWELHPSSAVQALQERVTAKQLSLEGKKKALVALGFIPTRKAANAMLQLVDQVPDDLGNMVQWWLQFRKTNDWKDYLKDWQSPENQLPKAHPQILRLKEQVADTALDLNSRLEAASELAGSKTGKLYLVLLAADKRLPDTIINSIREKILKENDRNINTLIAHYFASSDTVSYQVKSIADLSADPGNGKTLFMSNCLVCHKVGKAGKEIGPVLTNIQNKFGKLGIIAAIAHPASAVAFGSEPYLVTLKNGAILYGLLLSKGPVVTVMDTYGKKYIIDRSQIASLEQLHTSIMPPPKYMPLDKQQVADITAFLLQANKNLIP